MSDLIPLNSPNRCQRQTTKGQCELESVEGSKYCESHGGNRLAKKHVQRQYLLNEVRRKEIDLFLDHPQLYNMDEEYASLKLAYQKALESASDEDYIYVAGTLERLALTLDKLRKSNIDTEIKMGRMLSKNVVYQLMQMWVEIISKELQKSEVVDYENVVDRISAEFVRSIGNAKNESD